MKKAVIAVALSVLAALLSANVNTVAHAQGNLVAPSNVTAQHTGNPGEVRISWGAVPNAAYYRIGWVAYSDVEPIITSGGDWLEISPSSTSRTAARPNTSSRGSRPGFSTRSSWRATTDATAHPDGRHQLAGRS